MSEKDTDKWAHTVDLSSAEKPQPLWLLRVMPWSRSILSPRKLVLPTHSSTPFKNLNDIVLPWPEGLSALPTVDISRGSHTDSKGDFHVVNLLGRGMGVVGMRPRQLKPRVALKRLTERNDARSITALLHEAMITGSLEHPNIIPIHLLGLDQDKQPVMVMKKAEGVSWSSLLHDMNESQWKNWSGDRLERHIQILIQVCNAVHFSHTKGVIHRDIKPANIMVGEFGETYLLDWGVATKMENYQESDNRIWGTPAYMAPEMASGKPVCPQTDVFC